MKLLILFVAAALCRADAMNLTAKVAASITKQKIGYETSKLKDVLERIKGEAEEGFDSVSFWSGTGDPQISSNMEKELKHRGFKVEHGAMDVDAKGNKIGSWTKYKYTGREIPPCVNSCKWVNISWSRKK